MVPQLDHVVADVRHRLDEAAERYKALGFRLTERGRHTLGSENHLAVFGSDYLELLGTGEPGSTVRADLTGFPVGLNGLVFKLQGAEQACAGLRERGLPVQPVQSFSRPVHLDGRREEARFKTVRLEPRALFDGRVYFCEHLTPELVWRPEWQNHPNGALAITRVVIAARDPDRIAGRFGRLFGHDAAEKKETGRALRIGDVEVLIASPQRLFQDLGAALPDPLGRGDHMALLGIRVRSLSRAAEIARSGGVDALRVEPDRVVVPASQAMNVTLEFSE